MVFATCRNSFITASSGTSVPPVPTKIYRVARQVTCAPRPDYRSSINVWRSHNIVAQVGADGKRPCPAPSVRAFMVVRLRPRREAPTETVTFSRLRSPIPRTTTNLLSPGSATRDQAQCLHHGTSAPQAGFAPAGVPFPAPSGAPAGQSTKRGHAPAAQAAGWPHPTPQQRPTSRARSPTRTPPTRSYGRRYPLHSPPDSAFRVRYLDHDDPVPTAGTGPADSTRGPVPEPP